MAGRDFVVDKPCRWNYYSTVDKGWVRVSFERRDRGRGLENGFLIRIGRTDEGGARATEEFWLTFDQASRLNQHLSNLFQESPESRGLFDDYPPVFGAM